MSQYPIIILFQFTSQIASVGFRALPVAASSTLLAGRQPTRTSTRGRYSFRFLMAVSLFYSISFNPGQIALVGKNSPNFVNCGGTIINKRFVMTAAHCTGGSASSMRVKVGYCRVVSGTKNIHR